MIYIESPMQWTWKDGTQGIFLAGGITGCPDWQQDMRLRLNDTNLTLLNPRRRDFPIGDPDAARSQIEWEYEHLRKASGILFWFCAETLNPIVLYELGAWSMTDKPIFVGAHPDYKRIADVKIQTRLARPDVEILFSLEALAQSLEAWERAHLPSPHPAGTIPPHP